MARPPFSLPNTQEVGQTESGEKVYLNEEWLEALLAMKNSLDDTVSD